MLSLIKKIAQFLGIIAKEETPIEKFNRLEKELDELTEDLCKENDRKIKEMYAAINKTADHLK